MIRTSLFIGAAALFAAPIASANGNSYHGNANTYHSQHAPVSVSCERQKNNDRAVGSLIGAVAGGVLGVAIADGDDNHRSRRGYRNYRNYNGHRGYKSHRSHRNGNGNEIAGAVIGGVLGAVVGGEIAASSGRDCQTVETRYRNYGDMDVAPPTRSATGPAWEQPAPRAYRTSQTAPVTTTRTVTRTVQNNDDLYGGPVTTTRTYPTQPVQQPVQQAGPVCRIVQRETRMPDNSVVREPVEACQGSDGRWTFGTAPRAAY